MHATIALAAMDLGKHVYVQKPLTWSVAEARQLAKKAKSTKVATQMGNQGHSWDDARTAVEYVWAGAIGEVREVHVWTNRPLGYWPQGIPRPEARAVPPAGFRWNGPGLDARLATAMAGNYPKPEGLAWDLFLGVAPFVEYHPVYHPFNWRGWTDWGCGAIGDMGAHLMDHSMWALDLGYPTTIETLATPFNGAQLPQRDDDRLRVPGARRQAGGEADLVRRRPEAAEADRARRGQELSADRRRAAGRQQRQAAARHLRQESAAAAGDRCTSRSASRRRSCRAFRKRTTR